MTAITGAITSAISQAQPSPASQSNQSQAAQPQATANSFGDAVNVSLSAPAQAAVASQNTPSGTPTSQAPVVSQVPTVDIAQLISSAKQKVIPQVGVSGASDVVDRNGNISKVQLAIEIAEQAQKA